jgi:hypothetical protein
MDKDILNMYKMLLIKFIIIDHWKMIIGNIVRYECFMYLIYFFFN